jgi:tripartite-type tricarboxylate transporter receptor subunit TctC
LFTKESFAMLNRRSLLISSASFAFNATFFYSKSEAQEAWPTMPLKLIIANPPGGDDDTLSRFIGQYISPELGQPVIILNKGGASTTIGGTAAAQSAPDGYTILCMHMASIIQTVLRDNLSYSLASFDPIIGIGGYPMALVVSAKTPIKTMQDLKIASQKGDGVTFASGGPGTLGHLTSIRFLKAIGGNGVHIAYKNNPAGLTALGGGYTEMMFASAREAINLSTSDHIRVLAVTSKERLKNIPDVPTMAELGLPQIDSRLWYSYVAPTGTPRFIIDKLSSYIAAAVKSSAFVDRFVPASFQSEILVGENLKKYMEITAANFKDIIVQNNIKFTD